MSKYTTEVRYICETSAGLTESKGYNSINTILENCRSQIFDFDYPIFDQTYKPVLEKKILKHYYTREIATETVGLWKHYLDTRMNEIMPYYNKLYQSELLQFNPLYDVDLTTEHEKSGGETGTETGKIEGEVSKTATETTRNTVDTDTTDSITRSVTVEGSSEITNTKETSGTVTNSVDTENAETITEASTISEDTERNNRVDNTGTIGDSGTKNNTRTLNTTDRIAETGSDSEQGANIVKNDRWDSYSDTPQGSLQNITLNDGAYLTNARHIKDDGTGSSENKTTTYGKITTKTDTGTVQDAGSDSNTRTLNTAEVTLEAIDFDKRDNKTTTKSGTGRNEGETTTEETISTHETGENTTSTSETDSSSGTLDTTETGSANKTESGTTETDTTKSHNISTTEEYLQHVSGKSGGVSYSKMLLEYRETFLNIDMQVIEDLSDLFFGLW